jgi:hypothetical protein
LRGQRTYSVKPFSDLGDAQHSQWILSNCSTSASSIILYTNGASATTRLTVPDGKAYFCIINIAGIDVSGGAQYAHYVRKVAIKNNQGLTGLLGAVSTIGTDVESVGGYDVVITADNTNDALQITVTGGASTNIRWMATVDAIEIGFTPTTP